MTFAKLGSVDFDIYSEYGKPFKQLIDEFELNNLISPHTTNVSYPVALLNPELELFMGHGHKMNYAPFPSDTKENQLRKLSVEDLKEIASKTLVSLDKALRFLEETDNTDKVTKMDYILYLSGYISFNGLRPEKYDRLIDWINSVDFLNKTNTERRAIFDDLLSI
jgi:hypothetical protein